MHLMSPFTRVRRGLVLSVACASAFASAGCASDGGPGPAVRTLPGLGSAGYEQQIAAQGWDLSYRQEEGHREGTAQANGLAVTVVETGPGLPGALSSATCEVRGRDSKADLGFLDACLPSDSLDRVHHWLVAQLGAADRAGGPTLTFRDRSYRYTADGAHDEHTLRITPA